MPDAMVLCCLADMGMGDLRHAFEGMSFIDFIRMPRDEYKHFGSKFAEAYSRLLARISDLCRAAFLLRCEGYREGPSVSAISHGTACTITDVVRSEGGSLRPFACHEERVRYNDCPVQTDQGRSAAKVRVLGADEQSRDARILARDNLRGKQKEEDRALPRPPRRAWDCQSLSFNRPQQALAPTAHVKGVRKRVVETGTSDPAVRGAGTPTQQLLEINYAREERYDGLEGTSLQDSPSGVPVVRRVRRCSVYGEDVDPEEECAQLFCGHLPGTCDKSIAPNHFDL